MSDFHKKKAEKKKNAKLIFSAESLEQWKRQQIAAIKADIMKQVEEINQKLEEKDRYIEEKREKIKTDATNDAFILLICMPLKIMYDQYGWRSRKRLPELGQHISDYYQDFIEHKTSPEEYRDFVTNQIGLGLLIDEESEEENDRTETVESV